MQNVFNVKWLITNNYNYIYTIKGRHLFMNQNSIDINIMYMLLVEYYYLFQYNIIVE